MGHPVYHHQGPDLEEAYFELVGHVLGLREKLYIHFHVPIEGYKFQLKSYSTSKVPCTISHTFKHYDQNT
jgi:hypothetical protein